MKKTILIIALASTSAQADFFNGNKLWEKLNGDNIERSVALGYIMGVHDVHERLTHCSPSTVNAGQVKDVVYAGMSRMPEFRHLAAESIITEILKATWPCPANRSRSGT